MSRRHQKSKPAIRLTTAEKLHKRNVKRRSGPSAMRRRERRLILQPAKDGAE